MWRFVKRLLGLVDHRVPSASPGRVETDSGEQDLFRYSQRAREAEDTRQRISAPYFETMGRMQAKIRELDFEAAAEAARANLHQVPPFVSSWIEEAGELHVQSIPFLQEGGTMLALAGDREGLEELAEVVRSTPGLEAWADVPATHWESLRFIEAILAEVARNPGCKQNTMKDRLGASDGRRIGNLIQWLEKAERVQRVKEGATYTLWPPGHSEAPPPVTPPDLAMPAFKWSGAAVKVRDLDLANLPYVPLPRSPLRWEDRENRPGPDPYPSATEFFEVQDAVDWRITSVEKVPMEHRPDTAYRRFYPMADGLFLIDDLGKAEAHPGAAASALVFDRDGERISSRPLGHDLYRVDVNALGRGLIGISAASMVHAYGPLMEPLFEYDMRAAPEVRALMKRHEIEQYNLNNHLRAVAMAYDNSRFLVTGVDEAWCLSVTGEPLWGLRLPLKEGWQKVSTPVGHYGTSAEITQALETLELRLPVGPAEVKSRYRELARKWHPDLNPDEPMATAKMQAITAAAQALTGVDLSEERQAAGVRYEQVHSRQEIEVEGLGAG